METGYIYFLVIAFESLDIIIEAKYKADIALFYHKYCTILSGLLSTHLRRFQVIEYDVYMFRLPLLMIVYVQLFWLVVLC